MGKQVVERRTKETDITVTLDVRAAGTVSVNTGLPFFDHMLHAMAFHGGFLLEVKAVGDIDVDPHHLVEDTGLVLGEALKKTLSDGEGIRRYGSAVVPMDDALSEVVVDACGRPYLEFRADFPQARAGAFDTWLIREFLLALANKAQINVHATCRYGENSHHMAEALFKALGMALCSAFAADATGIRSTKGVLHEEG